MANTGIAAVGWEEDSGARLRVYFEDIYQAVIKGRAALACGAAWGAPPGSG